MMHVLERITEMINPSTKRGLRVLTSAAIVVILLFFIWWFVKPNSIIGPALEVKNIPTQVVDLMLAIIFYIISIVLFSHDELYYGDPEKNQYARAFQKKWPSLYLSEKLGIGQKTASNLWFDEFNKWRSENHPQHQQWQDTLSRGFACRLVYYLLKSSKTFFLISFFYLLIELLTLIVGMKFAERETLSCRILFTALMALIWSILLWTNRIQFRGPTGVWRRFNEINERNNHWIAQNIEKFEKANINEQGGSSATPKDTSK